MATESYVGVIDQRAGQGATQVRTVTVYPTAPASVGTAEVQQVISLAGSDGSLVDIHHGNLAVHSEELERLLKAIVTRLDILTMLIDHKYSPPDDINI